MTDKSIVVRSSCSINRARQNWIVVAEIQSPAAQDVINTTVCGVSQHTYESVRLLGFENRSRIDRNANERRKNTKMAPDSPNQFQRSATKATGRDVSYTPLAAWGTRLQSSQRSNIDNDAPKKIHLHFATKNVRYSNTKGTTPIIVCC